MIFWIASYPKSGNTWIRSFISTYYLSNSESFDFNFLKKIKQFPHEKYFNNKLKDINEAITNWNDAQKKIIEDEKIIFLKTHSALMAINNKNFTSEKYSLGGIYIIRDPRNVITSLKNHYSLSFQDSFEFMTNKNKYLIDDRQNEINYGNFQFISSWTNNYKSWKNYKKFEILFVKYEDLENNTLNTFLKILSFVNKLLKIKSEINEKRVQNILSSIDFDNLKKKESIEGFEESVYSKTTGKKVSFFNLGKKNKWQKMLTIEQIEKLNKEFKKDLIDLNYEF